MSRTTVVTLIALLSLGCATTPKHQTITARNKSDNVATYKLTFTGYWTEDTHPQDYPEGGAFSEPHFSGLIGATHDSAFGIIKENQPPSPGLERLAEEGSHSPLLEEIGKAIKDGRAGTLIQTEGLEPDDEVSLTFEIDANHPLFSVVAMIAPSPDWFAGVKELVLWDGDAWTPRRYLDVYAWDAGGDEGTTYEADDMDANPKQPTVPNESPHFMREGKQWPVGKLLLELL